jgi:predicted transcriptional regulator
MSKLRNPLRLHKRAVIDVISRTLTALEEAGKIDRQSPDLNSEIAGVVIDRMIQEDRIILHDPDLRHTHVTLRERQAAAKDSGDHTGPEKRGPRPGGPEIVLRAEDSVTDDLIYCLFDGVGRKMITRHILAKYNMTWPEYLEYCDLPADYPRVAPNYSDQHSKSVVRALKGDVVDKDKAQTRRTEAVLRKKRKLAETPTFGLTSEKQHKSTTKVGGE